MDNPTQSKELPSFIKHFKSKINEYERAYPDAHSAKVIDDQFIRSVKKMYVSGWTYDEVLACPEYKALVEYMIKKLRYKNFPWEKRIVDYVFTRGSVMNPFGPWITLDYLDPLAVWFMAKEILKNDKETSTMKLAGLLFAIKVISSLSIQRNKESLIGSEEKKLGKAELNDSTLVNVSTFITFLDKCSEGLFRIDSPSLIYKLADIDSRIFPKLAEILGLHYYQQKYGSTGKPRSRKWLSKVFEINQRIDSYREHNRNKFETFIKKRKLNITESAIDLVNKDETWAYLCKGYEYRFSCDTTSWIAIQSLKNNPFIRISKKNSGVYIASQLNLISYPFITISLYGFNRKMPADRNMKRFLSRAKTNEALKKLKAILEKENLNNDLHPIEAPNSKIQGRHFEQIKQLVPIVNDINNRGILLDKTKAETLLFKYEQKRQELMYDSDDDVNTNSEEEEGTTSELPNYLIQQIDNELPSVFGDKGVIMDLKKLLRYLNSLRSGGSGKLFGTFTTHGAETHRMTCRNINLQGMRKYFREHLLIAQQGWQLLSADVSGQDISVSANLAQKIYEDFYSFPESLHNTLRNNAASLEETINKLTGKYTDSEYDYTKTVNTITKAIINEHPPDFGTLSNYNNKEYYKDIRSIVKTCIYVLFYGGGINTEPRKQEKERLSELKQSFKRLRNQLFEEGYKVPKRNAIDTAKKIVVLSERLKFFIKFVERHNKFDKDEKKQIMNPLIELQSQMYEYIKRITKVSDISGRVKEQLDKHYPGITCIFELLTEYESRNGFTYPTLLGWKTVTGIEKDLSSRNTTTRSKNYVIQASGGEFIRQWLIELADHPRYKKDFYIVNVIHDQVVCEVRNQYINEISRYIIDSAKEAARKVGMNPETIHIPEVEFHPKTPIMHYSN